MKILTLEEQKQIVKFMEFIIANWKDEYMDIKTVLKKLDISYVEYRQLMNLSMPALRMKQECDKLSYMNSLLKNRLEKMGCREIEGKEGQK